MTTFKELLNVFFGRPARYIYKQKFYNNFSSWDSFCKFLYIPQNYNGGCDLIKTDCHMVKYQQPCKDEFDCYYSRSKGGCSQPCKRNYIFRDFFKYIKIEELKDYYHRTNWSSFEFSTKTKVGNKFLTGYTSYGYLEPSWYYWHNCSKVYSKIISDFKEAIDRRKLQYIKQKYREDLEKEKNLTPEEKAKKLELKKQKEIEDYLKYKEEKRKKEENRITLIIIDVKRVYYDYSSALINITFQIQNSNDTLLFQLWDRRNVKNKSTLAHLLYAIGYKNSNGFSIDKEIFRDEFEYFKSIALGKTLKADTIIQDGKREIPLTTFFYKIKD